MKKKDKDGISQAIDLLIEEGADISNLFEEGGLLKQLTKRLVEKALQSEMDEHLVYPKYERIDSAILVMVYPKRISSQIMVLLPSMSQEIEKLILNRH